jgi:hypothetical protein
VVTPAAAAPPEADIKIQTETMNTDRIRKDIIPSPLLPELDRRD